jgi:hypothetical protein
MPTLMPPNVRRLTLTMHVTASVSWVGALLVFFVHALASLWVTDDYAVRGLSLAMGLTTWFVVLPLAVATLVSGLVQALGTAWGLLKHYWVAFKLALTVFATSILLLKLQPISYLAEMAAWSETAATDLAGLRTSLAVHAGGGLFVLLATLVLAIYKPAGLTPRASRRNGESGAGPALPRWVKVCAAVVAALIVLMGLMAIFGSHGPSEH